MGHGGTETVAKRTGDILIEDAGNLRFQGGDVSVAPTWTSYAQLGHGSSLRSGARSGNISIDSTGAIQLKADNAYGSVTSKAQIGHDGQRGGGERSGTILVKTSGSLLLEGANTARGLAMIGHGGLSPQSRAPTDGNRFAATTRGKPGATGEYSPRPNWRPALRSGRVGRKIPAGGLFRLRRGEQPGTVVRGAAVHGTGGRRGRRAIRSGAVGERPGRLRAPADANEFVGRRPEPRPCVGCGRFLIAGKTRRIPRIFTPFNTPCGLNDVMDRL